MTETAIVFGCTASASDEGAQAEARQLTHDMLIKMLGPRRRSGVVWRTYGAAAGLRILADPEWGPDYEGHRAFLRAHPLGTLIAATAEAEESEAFS